MTVDDNYYSATRTRCCRVRIFPGTSSSPPPPSSSPPKPSHLCKIAVVGDALAGKSSIVHKFIHRRYVNHQVHHEFNVNHIDESGINGGDLGTSHTTTTYNNSSSNNNNDNINGGAASYNSMGTGSSFQSGKRYHYHGGERGEQQPTLAEYYKKDITIWSKNEDEASRAHDVDSQQHQTNPMCIRVQCWDVNIPPQFMHPSPTQTPSMPMNELDSHSCNAQSVNSDLPTLYNDHYNSNITESLLQIITRVDAILLVCQCPLPPTSLSSSSNINCFSNSSNASQVSHTTDVSSSAMGGRVAVEWPELDTLRRQIQSYTSFLRESAVDNCNSERLQQQQQESQQKQRETQKRTTQTIHVLLSCADLTVGEYSPRQYVTLSNRMDIICDQCGVVSWRMGTCIDNTAARNNKDECVDPIIEEMRTPATTSRQQQKQSPSLTLLRRMMKQQMHLMEDMEDAIEGVFMDIMITHILASRRGETTPAKP